MIYSETESFGLAEKTGIAEGFDMTDTQLQYFISIVQTGSYSEAALEQNISQSSVSKQIASLEEELGIKLFDRSHRRIALTDAGEVLYQKACDLLQKIDDFKDTAVRLQQGQRKIIQLLTLPIIGQLHFYTAINRFETEHERIKIEVIEAEEPELFSRIKSGRYHLAIVYRDPSRFTGDMHFVPLVKDEIVLAVFEDHRLEEKDNCNPVSTVPIDEIQKIPVMLMQNYTCVNHLCDGYFQEYNISPHVLSYGRPESILAAVDTGRCAGVVTRIHAAFCLTGNVRLLSFEPELPAILGAVVNPEYLENPDIQGLLEMLADGRESTF